MKRDNINEMTCSFYINFIFVLQSKIYSLAVFNIYLVIETSS